MDPKAHSGEHPAGRSPDAASATPRESTSQPGPGPDAGHEAADRETAGRETSDRTTAAANARAATRAARRLKSASQGVSSTSARAARGGLRGVRRFTQARGMGATGLYKVVEMHAFHMAGDAAMAIGLAGTLFFAATTAEARDQVALALLITMTPFAIVAPLIGPFLDRFRRGRRWAIGSTMAIRAFLCWVLAGAVVAHQWWLYPATLGCLVASKAYNVTRASAVPRLLPAKVTLVTANSRISLSGTAGAAIGGGLAGAASYFGPEWALRAAFAIFVCGTILAILLPPRVDSSEGEERPRADAVAPRMRGMPARVVVAVRCNAALRAYSGFLLLFLAFLLREEPLAGLSSGFLLAIVAGAAGIGAALGTGLGALIKGRKPAVLVRLVLAAAGAAAILAAAFYGIITIAIAALAAGMCQQLGKLSLDALIQREVPELVRTSIFARAETLLQLSWVVGGGVGILLPLIPWLGMAVCSTWLVLTLLLVLRPRRKPVPPSAAPASAS